MDSYSVRKLERPYIEVEVPASKSILGRALILAAFTEGEIFLGCGPYADDTRAMLSCLRTLGISVESESGGLLVRGTSEIPVRNAVLQVGSAGTAARFLTALLAYRGGDYEMRASEQMSRRPMQLLAALERAGVRFDYGGEPRHFPFRMRSAGITQSRVEVEAASSTQYASGLLLAAATGERAFTVALEKGASRRSYIGMTAEVIRSFGGECRETGNEYVVSPVRFKPSRYDVEPDVSSACYFYALSLLLGTEVLVRGLHRTRAGQVLRRGDFGFLDLLERSGVRFAETEAGLLATGPKSGFCGFDVDVEEFSDQTLTIAALAPFALTPTHIRGFSHIRAQECDRVHAIQSNLSRLGVPCTATADEIVISPAMPKTGRIETFGDHRVAMAFSLIGLKTGGIRIEDPLCCKKTFENFFALLDGLTS